MSSEQLCDVCLTPGRRRMGKTCPEGWMWASHVDPESGETYILATCSDACRASFWKPQARLEPAQPEPVRCRVCREVLVTPTDGVCSRVCAQAYREEWLAK